MTVTGQSRKDANTLTTQVKRNEMRWTGSGKMKDNRKTIIYLRDSKEHILGVGICLSSPVAKALIGCKPVNERIITSHFVTIIQAHAPTMEADDNKKGNFYKILPNVIDEIPRHDIKLLMGDFNMQIDKSRQRMKSTIGPNANITNDNGERFTLFCNLNDISSGNTFLKHKRHS